MKSKKILLLILIFSIFLSINIVSASDLGVDVSNGELGEVSVDNFGVDVHNDELCEVSASSMTIDEHLADSGCYADEKMLNSVDYTESDIISSNDNYVVYVDNNNSIGNGNGSEENPYSNLNFACNNINEYKEEITIKLFEGTYDINSTLIFNTNNLHIQSINGSVILKNLFTEVNSKQSFGLINSGNFTMSNIIFDSSSWNNRNSKNSYFTPFVGNDNLVVFNNCTFTGFYGEVNLIRINNQNNEYIFNNCKFVNTISSMGLGNGRESKLTFNHCIFLADYSECGIGLDEATEVIFDGIWFGQNSITRSYFIYEDEFGSEPYEINNVLHMMLFLLLD